jgi:hypothetical protein
MLRRSAFAAGLLAMGAAQGQRTFVHADTTFIERSFRVGYHAVFIASPNDSIWYERVAGPTGDATAAPFVRKQQRMLLELGFKPAAALGGRPGRWQDWVGVKRWNGAWYLYAPSDWGYHRQAQVHPQCIVTSEMDGPLLHSIVEHGPGDPPLLLDERCVSMVSNAFDPRAPQVSVRVHPLDEASGVCLWEFVDGGGERTYEAMVPRDRARELPLIVNWSPSRKQPELVFEEVGPALLSR